jgi:ABC-type antimicrobial peptide transport system permease subunit
MALIGLHAVLSFLVTSRTREFGVRMALGASPADIARLLLGRGTREFVWGLGLGLLLALAISLGISSQVEQIPPAGIETFAAIAALVSAGGALAIWRPARRAMHLQPTDALRLD